MEEEDSDTGRKAADEAASLQPQKNTAALTLHSTVLIHLMISEYLNDTMCSLLALCLSFQTVLPRSPLLAQTCACAHWPFSTHAHTHGEHWKTQSAVWARGLANELSYWNRKESARRCRKCYCKPHGRKTYGKLLIRTKKNENVLSLQMYQFTFRWSRLKASSPILYFFFTSISNLQYLKVLRCRKRKETWSISHLCQDSPMA